MHVEARVKTKSIVAVIILAHWLGILEMLVENRILSAEKMPMGWGFMICQAMYGSGRRTGMAVTVAEHNGILKGSLAALSVFTEVARGTSMRAAAGQRIVATSRLSIVAAL